SSHPAAPQAPTCQETSARSGSATRPRRLNVLAAVLALLAGLALGAGGFAWWSAGEGQVAGATATIEGPARLTVGTPATFTAELTGVTSWAWRLPDGRDVVDEPRVDLAPSEAGKPRSEPRRGHAEGHRARR